MVLADKDPSRNISAYLKDENTGDQVGEGSNFGQRLKNFLLAPQSHFTPLYLACHIKVTAYLAVQRTRGRELPGRRVSGNDALSDVAHDLLKYVFLEDSGPHFQKIKKYYESCGVVDFSQADSVYLELLYLPFFYRLLKQGLYRELRREHPEKSARLKTVENIFHSDEYVEVPCRPGYLALWSSLDSLCLDAKPVTRELMERLAWESVRAQMSTTDICRDFFERLAMETNFQNFEGRRELSYVLAMTIERLVLEISPVGDIWGTPEDERKRQAIQIAADRAHSRLETTHLPQLVREGAVTEVNSVYYARSCRLYLDDRCDGKGTDSMAEYFRAGFPLEYHDKYDQLYKYRFLKIMGLAKQYYIEAVDDLL